MPLAVQEKGKLFCHGNPHCIHSTTWPAAHTLGMGENYMFDPQRLILVQSFLVSGLMEE